MNSVPQRKFAVVREDPWVELEAAKNLLSIPEERLRSHRWLVVASGGCTALALAHARPDVEVHAFDVNPAQLAHVRAKQRAIALGHLSELGVGIRSSGELSQHGSFEGLFRILRTFVQEFVLPVKSLQQFFSPKLRGNARKKILEEAFSSPYWPVAFQLAFHTPFLHVMFGPAATQHAEPDSYPGYFQRVFERGLLRSDAPHNPFLQHVLLGAYRREDAHPFLFAKRMLPLTLHEGSLLDVPGLSSFSLVSLSNIFDWSEDSLVQQWAEALRVLGTGSVLVLRQLNNRRAVERFFSPYFRFDSSLGEQLQQKDRSLFYERVLVGVRI